MKRWNWLIDVVLTVLVALLFLSLTACGGETVVVEEEDVAAPVETAIEAGFDPICEGFRYTMLRKGRNNTCVNSYTTGARGTINVTDVYGYAGGKLLVSWAASKTKPVTVVHRNGTVATYP